MSSPHPQAHTAVGPRALDHVAVAVADRAALEAFLCEHLGMQVLERGHELTLVGADRRHGKLALYDAEGPRQPGVLARVALRVADLERALAELPDEIVVAWPVPELTVFRGPEGLELGLTQLFGGVDYDIDHISLRVADPDQLADALSELGFVPRGGALQVADKQVRLERGAARIEEPPMLRHIGVVVDSVEALEVQARERGLESEAVVDRRDRLAIILPGVERIRLEYVEERPALPLGDELVPPPIL